MTDRLTPPQLRDLADLIWSPDISPPKPPNNFYLVWSCLMEISEGLRNSAARREAEAKPQKHPGCTHPRCNCTNLCAGVKELGRTTAETATVAAVGHSQPQGEREGPGSAAAPLRLEVGKSYRRMCGNGPIRIVSLAGDVPTHPMKGDDGGSYTRDGKTLDRPAYDLVSEWAEDKPTPAADDFAHSLRSVTTVDHRWDAHALSIIRRYETDRHNAADAIDAANAEASSCAAAYKASEARVRELEADIASLNARHSAALDQRDAEKARADRLADALSLVLPLAKSHVATHDYASSRTYIDMAENELLKGGDRG